MNTRRQVIVGGAAMKIGVIEKTFGLADLAQFTPPPPPHP